MTVVPEEVFAISSRMMNRKHRRETRSVYALICEHVVGYFVSSPEPNF